MHNMGREMTEYYALETDYSDGCVDYERRE